MAARKWTCRRCKTVNLRRFTKCQGDGCTGRRPTRPTAAQKALKDTYEVWEARFGSVCNICGRAPSERRRLDRDHDHRSPDLTPRGLLCARCNRALPSWIDAQWLRKATYYLERHEERTAA